MNLAARDLDRHSDLIRVSARIETVGFERCEQWRGLSLGMNRGNRPKQGNCETYYEASWLHGRAILGNHRLTNISMKYRRNAAPGHR